MVGRWGMSRAIGPIAVVPMEGSSPFFPGVHETSESTQRLVDEEIRRIVEAAHREALDVLRQQRGHLDSLAAGLLEHETLDEARAYQAAGLPRNVLAQGPALSRDGQGNGSADGEAVSRPDGSTGPVPHGTGPRAS
jgi:cell division protease FtsH